MSREQLVRKCYRQQQHCAQEGHPSRGFYLREFANGVMHIFQLCVDCGAKVGHMGSLSRAEHPGWRDYPVAVDGPRSYVDGCRCGWCTRDDAERGTAERRVIEYQAEAAYWVQTASRLRIEREQRLTWHEYEQYLKTDRWAKVREQALARFDWRCATCHSDEHLQVHHRTYERVGCEYLTDLTVLCRYCHRALHDLWNQNDDSEAVETSGAVSVQDEQDEPREKARRIIKQLTPVSDLERIVHHLLVEPGESAQRIAAELEIDTGAVKRHLKTLEYRGVVERWAGGARQPDKWFVLDTASSGPLS